MYCDLSIASVLDKPCNYKFGVLNAAKGTLVDNRQIQAEWTPGISQELVYRSRICQHQKRRPL